MQYYSDLVFTIHAYVLLQGRPARGEWRQMPPFLGWRDFFFWLRGMCKSKITRESFTQAVIEIGPENSFNYPPRIHGTSSTTPLEIGPENSFNYPSPRIHGTSSTTPLEIGPIDGSSSPATFKVWLRPRGECFHDPGGIDAPVLLYE